MNEPAANQSPAPQALRRWLMVVGSAIALGVVALLTNLTTDAQLSGERQGLLAARFTVSMLANAGVVWAGVSILAGWLVRRPWQAAVAGIVAGQVALFSHYLLGRALSAPTSVVAGNEHWLVVAAVFGVPLGLVGAAIHARGTLGLLAGLVVPLGAIAEPFVRGQFAMPAITPWPTRFAAVVSGVLLIAAGLVGALWVMRARPCAGRVVTEG